MPSRKVYKHRKAYVSRPICRGGQTFRCFYKRKFVIYLGGKYQNAAPNAETPPTAWVFTDNNHIGETSWNKCDDQFMTTPLPMVLAPASLAQLLFETQYNGWNGYTNDSIDKYFIPAGSPSNLLTEAKYPDMFYYRYMQPVHYGLSCRVIRCRTVIDTSSDAKWDPSATDLGIADLSWQTPMNFYWRADYSNLNRFYPFKGPTPDTDVSFYYNQGSMQKYISTVPPALPQGNGGWVADKGFDPSAVTEPVSNFHEMLVQKRFAKCTVQPGKDCIMQMQANFKTAGLDGLFSDVRNPDLFNLANVNQQPVSMWLRNYFSVNRLPGQSISSGSGMIPGDLYMAAVLPEVNLDYYNLFNTGLLEEKPKARVAVEFELTTSLIIRCSEKVPDVVKWGGFIPLTVDPPV